MKIYLRTHPIGPTGGDEGWKYFGYTKNETDNRKYNRANGPWPRHIQQYGDDFTTEILLETDNQFEATLFCINYSLEHGIWNNPEYANMMMENAMSGAVKHKFCNQEYIDNQRKCNSPESVAKQLATKERNGCKNDQNKGQVTCRDLRTGLTLQVSKEEFDKHTYMVGANSKKFNY